MTLTLQTALLVIAIILFCLAAYGVPRTQSLGLAFFAGAFLVG